MTVHQLAEVEVAPGRTRQALGAAVRLARQLARHPSFREMRIYGSETSPLAFLVLTEWEDAESAAAAVAGVAPILEDVRAACTRWDCRSLEPLFHLHLPRRAPSAGVAWTVRTGEKAPARHKEFGLKAMSLPGTIGVLGGRCTREPDFLLCALEFETGEALADFAGSPTWHEWVRGMAPAVWRKEPRLEVRSEPAARRTHEPARRSERLGNLSVHIESSAGGANLVLRLHGCLDQAAASRFEQVRDALIAGGCRDLTLDVSQLCAATPEGLKTLVATARQVKAAGGHFALADNHGRYQRIVRAWRLQQTVSLGDPPTRRKRANLRLRAPGEA